MTTALRRVAGVLLLCIWALAGYAVPLHADDPPLEKRHLIAAIPGNMPPLYFLDGKTGEARGFGVDVIRAVAKNLDLEIYFKVFPTPREAMEALWAGQVDILPSAGISPVKNAAHPSVLVTDPFHTFRASLFVREGFTPPADLADYPAGKLGVFDRPIIRKQLEGRVKEGVVPFVDSETAVLALLSSGIDGFIGPEEMFRYLARHMRLDSHFQRVGLPLFEIKRGIFVHSSLPKVHQALNTEINAFIRGGKYSRLFMTWFGEPLTGYPVIPVIGAFLSAVLLAGLVVFFWRHRLLLSTNRNLEKIVYERTESLRQQVTERAAAERELMRAKETLEERVAERTEDLKREMEERLRTENELLESQKRYGAIFHGSRVVMLLIDPEDGSIVDANPSACEFYGYDHALFTQMKIWEINTLPPEIVKERMADAVAQKKSRFLFDHRLASGEIRHIDGRPTPLQIEGKTYIFSIVIDVTEQVRAENALRESEGLLTAILDNSPTVIHLKDCDGRYLLANTRLLDSHHLTLDQVIGKKSHDFLPREFADEGVLYDRRVIEEKRSISYESLLHKGDGKERHLLSVKFPLLDAAGSIFAIGTISNDITDLKQAEKALRHSQRLETVGQLTGGVAHDFNNMLGVIIMNLEFLRDVITDVPERALPALDAIQKAAWRGADLTKRLLAFSRKSNNNVTKVNVNELLQSMKELLERTLTENIEIHIDATPGLWTIEVEEGGLEDVLLNLAINSRDAMTNGGKLTIVTRNMVFCDEWIGNRPDIKPGEYVLLEVADNGPGMSEEVIERAFEPFFTTKPTGEGTGLGLSMVYGFVRRSNGEVRIKSSPGQGTRVQILFPRAAGHANTPTKSFYDLERPHGNEIVLVVDDEKPIRDILCNQLNALGYQTCTAEDGVRAMNLLESSTPVNLLLCDVVMPGGMSGDQVATRAKELRPEIKVVLMSGYTKNLSAINKAGITSGDVLMKPFTAAKLAKRVRQALDEGSPALIR